MFKKKRKILKISEKFWDRKEGKKLRVKVKVSSKIFRRKVGKLKCQKHCEIQNVLSTKVKVRHTGPKDKRVKDKEENVKHIF